MTKEEIPYLLEQRVKKGLLMVPVLVSECPWRLVEWIKEIQLVPRDARPLDTMTVSKRNGVLSGVAHLIAAKLRDNEEPISIERRTTTPAPEAVDLSRLPVTGAELFGRTEELRLAGENVGVAHGSVGEHGRLGRRRQVNAGEQVARTHGGRRLPRCAQGVRVELLQPGYERATSADLFVDQALRFFGDPAPTEGSAWDKADRLAALLLASRNLLVLDGLEPLQSPTDGWRVQDPGLGQLLRRLGRSVLGKAVPAEDVGLCVITSRQRVADLDGFPATAVTLDLEEIDSKACLALLRVRGVRGTDAELEKVACDFGCQALAVNLLASFLIGVTGHPASAAAEIPNLRIAGRARQACAAGVGGNRTAFRAGS